MKPDAELQRAAQAKKTKSWTMQPAVFLLRPGHPVLKAPPSPPSSKEALFVSDLVTILENWWPTQSSSGSGWLQLDCKTSYPQRSIIAELLDQVSERICALLGEAIQATGIRHQTRMVTDFGQFQFRLQFTILAEVSPDSLDDRGRKPSYTDKMPTDPKESHPQQLQSLIDRIFEGLPADPKARLAAIEERVDLFRLRAKQELEPALNNYLRQVSGKSVELNESIAELVNHHLRPLGLRIEYQDQECGLHFLGKSKKNPYGRFMLVPIGTSTAIFTASSVEQFANALTPLQLRDPFASSEASR